MSKFVHKTSKPFGFDATFGRRGWQGFACSVTDPEFVKDTKPFNPETNPVAHVHPPGFRGS